jgi:hypothetical protein
VADARCPPWLLVRLGVAGTFTFSPFFPLVEVQEERVPISSNVLLDCDPGERDMLVPYTVIVVCSFSGGFGARLLSSTQELDEASKRF